MGKTAIKAKILYGEGDSQSLKLHLGVLEKAGYSVTTAVGRRSIEETLRQDKFEVVDNGVGDTDPARLSRSGRPCSASARVAAASTPARRPAPACPSWPPFTSRSRSNCSSCAGSRRRPSRSCCW